MLTPSFDQIPFRIAFGALIGMVSANFAGSSSKQWARIAVISSLADSVFYLSIMRLIDRKFSRKVTLILIHAIVSAVEITALHHLELIAKNGAIAMTIFALVRCTSQAFMFKEEQLFEVNSRVPLEALGSSNREHSRRERNSPVTSPRMLQKPF